MLGSKVIGSVGYSLNIPHLEVGEITHLLTIDPNFQRDIQVVSDSFANEISYSVCAVVEIRQEDLTPQQVSGGLPLLNILKSAFQSIPNASMILSAYTERHANYALNGYEALRKVE